MRSITSAPFIAAALAATALTATPVGAEGTSKRPDALPVAGASSPALEILRQINHNPALAHSKSARSDALLTTGSIVKSGGEDRVLYHFPAIDGGLRLGGETASLEWPVHIAREQLAGTVMLRLAYQNAVSIMPEASYLAVEVNGVMIGKRAIQSPDRSRVLSFPVPTNILVPGFNAVRLSARQRHRVDCSIRATHELWTDVDPTKTGLVFSSGNSALKSLDSIAAIARNKAGQVKIRMMAPQSRDAAQVARLMLLGQQTAIHADFSSPIVEVASEPGKGPGLDLFTGSLRELRAIAPDYAKSVHNQNTLQILSRDGDERVALIYITGEVTSDGDQDGFKRQLESFFPEKTRRGSVQGLSVAHRLSNNQVSEGKRIPFSQLGLESEEFNGRLYRRSFQINLPSDYFAADYNQAEMHLATGYSAGLDPNNKFIIRVNGVTATGFALSKPNGHVFHDKMLRLPLSSFRPGVNTIELEAQLASSNDQACDPAKQIRDRKRFVMSGKSWIRFPRLAHLARLPDLAGTVGAAFPYVIAGKAKPTTIAVPSPGYTELSAAANFATKIAVNAGVPLDFDLHYGTPEQSTKNAIVVATYGELPRSLSANIKGIDQGAFQTAWQSRNRTARNRQIAALQLESQDEYGVDTMSTASIDKIDVPAPAFSQDVQSSPLDAFNVNSKTSDPLDAWNTSQAEDEQRQTDAVTFTGHIKNLFSSVFGLGEKKQVETPIISNPNSDVLLTQSISPSHDQGVWTVLTAPSEQALKSGTALISKPDVSARITGETATINGIDRSVTASISAQSYIQVREFSLRNAHLIVAGWFSNNHLIYSLLLLAGLLGFGAISTRLLKSVGVDREEAEARADV